MAGRRGWAGLVRTGRRRVDPARRLPSFFSLQRIADTGPDIFSRARTNEILFKPLEEQNQRLTTSLSAVYQRDDKRALFLAAEQWNDAFLSL